jgi:hypothetical protein
MSGDHPQPGNTVIEDQMQRAPRLTLPITEILKDSSKVFGGHVLTGTQINDAVYRFNDENTGCRIGVSNKRLNSFADLFGSILSDVHFDPHIALQEIIPEIIFVLAKSLHVVDGHSRYSDRAQTAFKRFQLVCGCYDSDPLDVNALVPRFR